MSSSIERTPFFETCLPSCLSTAVAGRAGFQKESEFCPLQQVPGCVIESREPQGCHSLAPPRSPLLETGGFGSGTPQKRRSLHARSSALSLKQGASEPQELADHSLRSDQAISQIGGFHAVRINDRSFGASAVHLSLLALCSVRWWKSEFCVLGLAYPRTPGSS